MHRQRYPFEGLTNAGSAISVVGGTLVVDGVNLESNSWVIAVYDGDSTPSNVSVSNSKISGNQAGLTVHGDSSMANTVALNNVMIETKYCGVYLAGNRDHDLGVLIDDNRSRCIDRGILAYGVLSANGDSVICRGHSLVVERTSGPSGIITTM